MDFLRKTWAEIDTSALIYNLNVIKKASASQIIAVVKANAYGHATEILTPIMEEEGVDYFAVSNLDEALSLRELGLKKPIIILGYGALGEKEIRDGLEVLDTIIVKK